MINGGVKFFDQNFALFKFGTTATASSGTDTVNAILDISKYTQWESVGSNDLTQETITVTLSSSKTFDRILLSDINLKKFEIKYWDGAAYVAFSNVKGLDNVAKTGITETLNDKDAVYYEFDAVSTNLIQVTMDTTIIPSEQKRITTFISTKELGTFEGFPRVNPSSDRNESMKKTLSRKFIVQKTYETNDIGITFKTHPKGADISLIDNLFNREEPFLVYLCGGRTSSFFKYEQKQWGVKDVFNMQIVGKLRNEWEKGVYILGANKTIKLVEHV